MEPRLLPAPLPASGPFRPAVALRLLDFPTLLVRAPHCGPGPLVPFGRGKSCLFRLRPDVLKGLLRRSPLHALLLALPPTPGPARLIGSSSVSLSAAAEELLQGKGPGGRRGRFPLRDLMGEPVGELGLSYRLTNLGRTLLDHLGQGAAPEEPRSKEQPPSFPLDTQSERGLSLELIPEAEEDLDLAPDEGSLLSFGSAITEPPSRHDSGCGDMGRVLEKEANVFCPPAMYYNHPAGNPCSTSKASGSLTVVPVAKPEEKSVQQEEITLPPIVPVKGEPSGISQEATTPSRQVLGSPQELRQNLSQLPLLNALLVELSLLNSQPLQSVPSTVHPQLAWIYRNAEDSTKPSRLGATAVSPSQEDKKASLPHKDRGRSPSPKLKRNRLENLKSVSPSLQQTWTGKGASKATVPERSGSPEKNNTKENSPPRRKLTYGLTNTLKLRLQRTNPGMLKVHEKREHHRKKQAEVLVEKKVKISPKGKIFRGPSEHHPKSSGHHDKRGISDQKEQFTESIETLIQSSIKQDGSVTKRKVASDRQSGVAGRSAKTGKNTKVKSSSEMTDHAIKEKSLEIHLPRICSPDTDDVENKTAMETEKIVLYESGNTSTLHNHSQSNNCERGHELKKSDAIVASNDNTGYSEDFTNAGSSLESSPEPQKSTSDMDSESKIFENSLVAVNISPPLPIPSAVSPVQSFKKTYVLKSNKQDIFVAVHEMNDDDPLAASVPKEEFADEAVEKKGSRDMQIIENKQVRYDVDCNEAKAQSSVEKSHSLRTSQVSSYLPSIMSHLDPSEIEYTSDEDDDFDMLDITNQCRHISELVVNKLPGYTM